MKTYYRESPGTMDTDLGATIERSELLQLTGELILQKASTMIAERYVEENYVRIAELLSPEAVANLAVAAAGNSISRSIDHSTAVRAEASILSAQALLKSKK